MNKLCLWEHYETAWKLGYTAIFPAEKAQSFYWILKGVFDLIQIRNHNRKIAGK